MSAIKPVCLPLECVVNDVNLLRNTFLTHELEFSVQNVYDSSSILKKRHDSAWKAYFLRVQQRKPG